MDRLFFVAVGGAGSQKPKCVYCGTDGDAALAAFEKAQKDTANEAVRLFRFPDHIRAATPARLAPAKPE